jgi:hypothetical protein
VSDLSEQNGGDGGARVSPGIQIRYQRVGLWMGRAIFESRKVVLGWSASWILRVPSGTL